MRVYSVRPLSPASRPRRAAGAYSLVTAWSFLRCHTACPKRGNNWAKLDEHSVLCKSAKSGSKSFSGVGILPSPKESHTAAHKGKHRVLLRRDLMGRYTKPGEADVRVYSVRPLPPASRPRRAAESVVSYSKLVSELTK